MSRAQGLLTPCPGALEADSAKLFQAASRAQGLFARSQQEVLMRLLLYEDFLGCFRSEGILARSQDVLRLTLRRLFRLLPFSGDLEVYYAKIFLDCDAPQVTVRSFPAALEPRLSRA